MKPLVSIILVNYNGLKFNQDCILSILDQSYQHFEIIFVNNSSTDGSCEQVEEMFAQQIANGKLKIIQPGYNTGFAGGNNRGVQNADPKSEYICLLNNDTVVPQDWLEKLVGGIQSDATLGAVGSIIYDQGYEQQMEDFLFAEHKKGINNYFFDSVIVPQTLEDIQGNLIYTTGLSGCCLLYQKKLLELPFDDVYFAYMEDTAICIKIILQGYRIAMVKDSIVHHFGSGSFGIAPTVFKAFHGLKNYMLNFIVLSQGWYRIIILPWFSLGLVMRSVFNHPGIRLRGLMQAKRWILTHLPTIYKLKRELKVTIKPNRLYRQLSEQFICTPFYTQVSNIQQTIVTLLNTIARTYFALFKRLIR